MPLQHPSIRPQRSASLPAQARFPATLRLALATLLFHLFGLPLAHASELDIAQRQWLAGQRPQAVATLEAALKQTPDELKLRFALGVMRMELGEQGSAQQIFIQLTEDFPDLADPYNNLAVIHASQGDLDRARNELEQALRLQPNHAQAQENLGDVLLRQALRAYQRAQQALAAPSTTLALKLKRTHDLLQEASRRPQ
ncbi:tetratricopeptide repeat protein [Paucibacter sp. DJ1R-11]|uniref:tetratricopeptide repeat protein n=1 Tax=Paucibacter sp. DJ1R-11 TaxID=2893556 RepID=UPI0021E4D9E0|nr:tetratricopeptide repeat protein [Paucibacter sp. DJ1R-11]MCV2363552.1 tetratricopeptide repeat protein [Paucibacter sp. DJ1R-11]